MRKIVVLAMALAASGCAEHFAQIDDAKCRSYGAEPGEPAYVTCRSQLDAARTAALSSSGGGGTRSAVVPDVIPAIGEQSAHRGR